MIRFRFHIHVFIGTWFADLVSKVKLNSSRGVSHTSGVGHVRIIHYTLRLTSSLLYKVRFVNYTFKCSTYCCGGGFSSSLLTPPLSFPPSSPLLSLSSYYQSHSIIPFALSAYFPNRRLSLSLCSCESHVFLGGTLTVLTTPLTSSLKFQGGCSHLSTLLHTN